MRATKIQGDKKLITMEEITITKKVIANDFRFNNHKPNPGMNEANMTIEE